MSPKAAETEPENNPQEAEVAVHRKRRRKNVETRDA